MATEDVSSELIATYANLGTFDGVQYHRGEECLACVKDLIRALRDDDSQCEIRRQLGRAGILKKDLLHILVESGDDTILRNDVLRLLVNLTQPAYLCFGSAYPKNKERGLMRAFMEVNQHLRTYKQAFTSDTVMNVLGSMLAELCQKEWEDREDDDIIVIERILLLIRNVLHISPDPLEERRTEDDVNLHDQIIWKLHVTGVDDLLLFLGSNSAETQWCIHVLEIFFLLFKEQSPSILAGTGKEKSRQEREKTELMLDEVLEKVRDEKRRSRELRGARHSRFGGTFVVHNQKSISGKERVFHKPISQLNKSSYDAEKRPRRVNKLRRPVSDLPKERTSTYSIRLVLKNLCVQFLQCAYNTLMKTVRESIMRHRAMENDETYYLWCLHFFMEFSRIHDFRVDIVGETLQLPTLHYVITLCANYYESMVIEKRSLVNARQWAQRLHYALKTYKEILLNIQDMGKSHDEVLTESAKVIVSNILYHPEYREVLVTLLRNFQDVFQTRAMLRDLVETTHVYVRMLEVHCQHNAHVVTQERRKKSTGRKKRKQGLSGAKALNEDQLIDLWEAIDARVEELMEGVEPLPRSHSPFNPASQVSVEEQKIGAMGMIRMLLIEATHPEAVSLLRAAREVWPGEEFGNSGLSVDEEMDVMRSILYNTTAVLPIGHLMGGGGSDDEEGEEDGGERSVVAMETQFNLKSYLEKFANNKIVRVYSLVLQGYSTNTEFTNNAAIKLLYYISDDLKMAPFLFHISIFTTLMAIMKEPRIARFKNLQKFACYVVRGFFEMAQKNSLMFVELLVWKTSRDCYELEGGYGTIEREKERLNMATTWTREQEEELAVLYESYKGEEDIVGCIEAALEGSEVRRSRKQVLNQIVKQGLVSDRKQLHKRAPKKKAGGWDEDELDRLRQVYSETCEGAAGEGAAGEGAEREKELLQLVTERFPHRGVRDVAKKMREEGFLEQKRTSGKGGRRGEEENSEGKRKFLSASYVDTSEDSDSEDDAHQKQPVRSQDNGGTGATTSNREGKKKFLSASYVDTSEDSDSEDDTHQKQPVRSRDNGGTGATVVNGSQDVAMTPRDVGVVSQDVGVVSPDGGAAQYVSHLRATGYVEELQWLEAYLLDEARDRTVDDEWEEMSIVAYNTKVAKALDTTDFQKLLKSLGLKQPTEQESFWRIPSSMPPQALTQAVNILRTSTASQNSTHMTPIDGHMTPIDGHMTPSSGHMIHANGHTASIEDHVSSPDVEYEGLFEEKRCRSDALKLVRKMKRKSPLSTPSPSVEKSIVKKPRLALRSEFLESDDSGSELGSTRDQQKQSTQKRTENVRKRNKHFFREDSDDEERSSSSSSSVSDSEEESRGEGSILDQSSLVIDSQSCGRSPVVEGQPGKDVDSELSEDESRLTIVE